MHFFFIFLLYFLYRTTLGRLNFFGDSSDLRFIVEDTEGTMSPGVSYSSLFIFDQKSQELSINNLDFVGISVGVSQLVIK